MKEIIFSIVFCCMLGVTQAKEITYHDDYQQWFGLKVNYAPSKKLTIGAQYVCRTEQMLSTFEGSYYYLQARYRINKHWYPDMQVRVVDDHEVNLYRLECGMQYRYRKHKYTAGFRTAYFNERKLLVFDGSLHDLPAEAITITPVNYWRNRISLRRSIGSHWLAYASLETYSQYKLAVFSIKRVAAIGGVDLNLGYNSLVSLEYLYQPDYHSDHNVHLQSLTLGYEYDIPKHNGMRKELKERFKDN